MWSLRRAARRNSRSTLSPSSHRSQALPARDDGNLTSPDNRASTGSDNS